MRSTILMMSALGLALLVSGRPASADEAEDLQRMAFLLQKEASELFEKGRAEEAHSLENESEGLLIKVRQLQSPKQEKSAASDGDRGKKSAASEPESQYWKKCLQVLHAAREQAEAGNATEQELDEIREQIRQTESKLAHLSESSHPRQKIPPQFRAQAEKLESAARRLQHVKVAAENLKAAEMHEMAYELMKQAEAMQHEMQAAKMELAKLMQNSEGKDQGPKGELLELRTENEQLRKETDK